MTEDTDLPVIEAGAQFRFTDTARNRKHGVAEATFEVDTLRVDEDGNVQVSVTYDDTADVSNPSELVTDGDIHERFRDGEVERVNTGHEAYLRRSGETDDRNDPSKVNDLF